MSNFEMVKKNFDRGLWTIDMLTKLVNKNKLSTEEFNEIVGSLPVDADLNVLKENKVIESKEMLESYLIEHPLIWTDGNSYTVTSEKQALLTSQLALYQVATAAGQPYTLQWNTTGGECTDWTYENLCALALAIGDYVHKYVSYQQSTEINIMNCTSVEELDTIVIDYASVN